MDPVLFLYVLGGLVLAFLWLSAGVTLGNTVTQRERRWMVASTMLVFIFWPIIALIIVHNPKAPDLPSRGL